MCCTCLSLAVFRVLSLYGTLTITDTILSSLLFPSLHFISSSSSSSYTHIFSQSELRRHDSELHGETLDAELEQFEQELMEGGDVMVDSKTGDDLMLEMEEFL